MIYPTAATSAIITASSTAPLIVLFSIYLLLFSVFLNRDTTAYRLPCPSRCPIYFFLPPKRLSRPA